MRCNLRDIARDIHAFQSSVSSVCLCAMRLTRIKMSLRDPHILIYVDLHAFASFFPCGFYIFLLSSSLYVSQCTRGAIKIECFQNRAIKTAMTFRLPSPLHNSISQWSSSRRCQPVIQSTGRRLVQTPPPPLNHEQPNYHYYHSFLVKWYYST